MSGIDVDVRALLQRLESLEARVHALEAGAAQPVPMHAAAAVPATTAAAEEIPEEVLATIAAAIGAFLGVKARIRQVRMVHGGAWAQQGRASVMASHGLAPRH